MTERPREAPDLSALSSLAPELAAAFASVGTDIALVIDQAGVIRNVSSDGAELGASAHEWLGRPWVDTVTGDTRRKIELLLEEVGAHGVSRRREVNHPSPAGLDIPITYAAVRLGEHGPVVAVGRDLRAMAAIQQRFVESQQEMERHYWKLRQAESRYRLLFQVATDAVLVVDAQTLLVVEANAAATEMFDLSQEQLIGRAATIGIHPQSRGPVEELLTTARSTGRPAEIRVRRVGRVGRIDVSATPVRGDRSLLLLVRARLADGAGMSSDAGGQLMDFVERTPDPVVITDSSGRVQMANPAFVGWCRLAGEAAVKGQPLGDWLGGFRGGYLGEGQHADPREELSGVNLASALSELRMHGILSHARAIFNSGRGPAIEVEVSAALLPEGDQECIGFTLRRRRVEAKASLAMADALAAALQRVALQMGDADLPELMSQAVRVAERHLLDTALDRSGGDHDAAAALLGIGANSLNERLQRLQPSADEAGGPLSI